MPATIENGVRIRKALKEFAPNLAKETQKEISSLLKVVVRDARGFVPNTSPMSGWSKNSSQSGKWSARAWNSSEAKAGIGYRSSPSKKNRKGFQYMAQINNKSTAGAIYETAGRKNPEGRPIDVEGIRQGLTLTSRKYSSKKSNKNGKHFIDMINKQKQLENSYDQTGKRGRRTNKFKGRLIFAAWKQDGGKTNAAVMKAIEKSRDKFYDAVYGKMGL